MRRRALSGSPWDPVEMITSRSSAQSSSSRGGTRIPSGTSMCPSERPMFTFLRIERPMSETLRSRAAAAWTTCWTRWMFEAKQVTTIRPGQRMKSSPRRGPTILSLGENPGRSAFVESPHSSSRPSAPSWARRPTSAGIPSTGVWSNL